MYLFFNQTFRKNRFVKNSQGKSIEFFFNFFNLPTCSNILLIWFNQKGKSYLNEMNQAFFSFKNVKLM